MLSDNVILGISTGFFTLITTTITVFIGYLTAKLNKLEKVGEATHILVNSNMGVQLKLNALTSQRLAEMTKAPEDILSAEIAKGLSDEYIRKQDLVDSLVDGKRERERES